MRYINVVVNQSITEQDYEGALIDVISNVVLQISDQTDLCVNIQN